MYDHMIHWEGRRWVSVSQLSDAMLTDLETSLAEGEVEQIGEHPLEALRDRLRVERVIRSLRRAE